MGKVLIMMKMVDATTKWPGSEEPNECVRTIFPDQQNLCTERRCYRVIRWATTPLTPPWHISRKTLIVTNDS